MAVNKKLTDLTELDPSLETDLLFTVRPSEGVTNYHKITNLTLMELVNGPTSSVRTDLFSVSGAGLVKTAAGTTVEAEIAAGRSSIRGNTTRTYGAIGCAIRSATAGVFTIIDDSNHTPTPSTMTVTPQTDGTLLLDYSGAGGVVVSDLTITPDETMAAQPLAVGGSVASDTAFFSFFCALEIFISGTGAAPGYAHLGTGEALATAATAPSAGNTWGFFLDTPNGVMTINHLSETYSATTTATGFCDLTAQNSANTVDAIRLVTSSKTSKVFQSYNFISGTIAAGAANPAVTASVLGCSATWSAGTLTLTTPFRKQKDAIVVTSRDPAYRAHVVSTTNTTAVIEFYDSSGVKFTGSPSIICAFSSPTLAPCAWTSGCKPTIKAAPVFCYAQNVATGGSGNYWITGKMIREAD